jgi:hypothetical protein
MILVSVMLPVQLDIMVKTEDVTLVPLPVETVGDLKLTNVLIVTLITIYVSTNVSLTSQLTIIEKPLLILVKYVTHLVELVGDLLNGNVMTVSLVTIT